jgi:ABC-2 type transport system permease protein
MTRPAAADDLAPPPARTLRRLFLTLFLRGRSSRGMKRQGAPPKSIGRKLALSLVAYAAFGLVALAFRGQSTLALSAYLHTMTLMFLGMFVASSAGEILFNREEADILMHRPIDPRSLLWAKVRVLVEVSAWLAGAFNLAGFFVGANYADRGWLYVPAHALSTLLLALFCTGSVVLAYQLCLRWFGRERLEGLMTTAQVLISVLAVLSSQILPTILEFVKRSEQSLQGMWFVALLPPAWFAGFDDALAGKGAGQSWGLAGVGCLVTALVLWAAFGKLARDYEAGLQLLNEQSGRVARGGGRRRWLERLIAAPPCSWWLRDPRERAAFQLVAAYLLRDRDFKLRVYPAVAPFLILPIVFLVREVGTRGNEGDGGLGAGFGFAFAAGYIATVPLLAVVLIQYSAHWHAADVFRLAPLPGPAPLLHGARKAVLLLLTLPVVVALAATAWFARRDPAGMALLLPGLMTLPLAALVPGLRGHGVPLSQPPDEANSATRGIAMFVALFATLGLSVLALVANMMGWLGWLILAEFFAAAVLYFAFQREVNRAVWPPAE